MADRRMFKKTIIDSDMFLDMPLSSQALYFHLSMRADDDGFVNNPKKIQRMIGASDDDLRVLLTKQFLIPFESGIVVITHWRVHNYIQKDRYHPTEYTDERALLTVKDNGTYTTEAAVPKMDTPCIQSGHEMDTEVRLGKDRIGKDRIESRKRKRFTPPTLEEVAAYCKERHNNVDPQKFFDYYSEGEWKDAKGNPVRSWKQKVLTWERENGNPRPKNDPRAAQNYSQRTYSNDLVDLFNDTEDI